MGLKMDKTTKIVVAVVGSLGLLSAIMGFSAEGTKLNYVLYSDDLTVCYIPRNSATGLAICASIFLTIAQVTFAVVSGCCGCCKSSDMPSESNRVIVLVCAVFSWVAAVIAFSLFLDGATVNSGGAGCGYTKDGIFAGAAVLTLAATALGLSSYVLPRKQQLDAGAPPKAGGGIAMGQPQFPQQSPHQGYGQAPPPYFPQHSPSPPPQGYGQYPPPPAQGYGAHPPNQQFHHPQGHAQV